MGEDIKNASAYLQVAEDNLNKQVENEVPLLLQDDLEALNTCFARFWFACARETKQKSKDSKSHSEGNF